MALQCSGPYREVLQHWVRLQVCQQRAALQGHGGQGRLLDSLRTQDAEHRGGGGKAVGKGRALSSSRECTRPKLRNQAAARSRVPVHPTPPRPTTLWASLAPIAVHYHAV